MWNGSDDRLKGTILLLTGAVLISFAPVFVRLTTVGPMATGFYRVAMGGVVLLGIAAVRKEPLLPPRSVMLVTLAAGLAGMALMSALTGRFGDPRLCFFQPTAREFETSCE